MNRNSIYKQHLLLNALNQRILFYIPNRFFSKKVTTHESTTTAAWGNIYEKVTTVTNDSDNHVKKTKTHIPRLQTTIHTPSEPILQFVTLIIKEILKNPKFLKAISTAISDGIYRLSTFTSTLLIGTNQKNESKILIDQSSSIDIIPAIKLKPTLRTNDEILLFLACNYSILGVEKGTSKEKCKEAYHKLCMRWHPDYNQDPDAEKVFILLTRAHHQIASLP